MTSDSVVVTFRLPPELNVKPQTSRIMATAEPPGLFPARTKNRLNVRTELAM